MGSIGWLLLGYWVLGMIVNSVSTILLIFIAAYKDCKETKKKHEAGELKESDPDVIKRLEAFDEMMDETSEAAEVRFDPGNPARAKFKLWLIGIATWPVSVPTGWVAIWKRMKETEQEE